MSNLRDATIRLTAPSLLDRLRRAQEEFPLISIQEIAKQYGVSMRTLRRWQAKGLMPGRVKHGRWLKYQKAEVEAYIARNRQKPEAL